MVHRFAGDGLDRPTDPLRGDEEEGQEQQGEEGDPPFQRQHGDQRRGQHDDVGDHAAEGSGHRSLGPDHVVVQARDECTGLGAGEERDGQSLDVVEQGDAQIEDDAFADLGRLPPLEERHRRFDECGDHDQERQEEELAGDPRWAG